MSGGNGLKYNLYSVKNKVELIRGGADYFDKLEAIIDAAHYTLQLQTYIYDPDETGERVARALIRAAGRGVKVYVMVDGYASQRLSAHFEKRFKDAGVHFCFFEPFFRSKHFYIGRRLHHKVVVVDACKCMVAGLNISNRYNDWNGKAGWLDWAVYAEGTVAEEINDYCAKLWDKEQPTDNFKTTIPASLPMQEAECMVRMRKNDWVNGSTDITRSYLEMFVRADKNITIMSSYFWPARKLLKKMAKASRRGVKIRLILAGRSDIAMTKYAERYMYRWLFRNNIEIYEYQDNILHGKLAMYDDRWVTVGSYNVNDISAHASVELNLDVKDIHFSGSAKQKIDEIVKNSCRRIMPETYKSNNNIFRKLLEMISYRFIHLVFFMFTFYFKQNAYNNRY